MAPGELNARFSITRIRDRLSERQARRRLRALAILLAGGLVTTQVFPTLAENVSGGNQSNSETATVTTTLGSESPTATTELGDAASAAGDETQTSDPEPSPEPSPPPPPPPRATSTQDLLITMPSSVRVDPRAPTVFLPQSSFFSFNTLLVCISSPTLRFDLGQSGVIDDSMGEGLILAGDQTNSVLVTGYPMLVNSFINGERGLRIFRTGAGVAGQVATFRFVDISEPALDESLCGDGSVANIRYLQVVPLGLTQNITKAKVGLEKGQKKG